MKTEKRILTAFILNLGFSILEFVGGALTNSVSITSDAIHDLSDALSIGISYILERKSKQRANHKHSFGYARYSLLGSAITMSVLVAGSLFMFVESLRRIWNPEPVNYQGMIGLAVFGCIVNLIAYFVTHGGRSHNQKAVNLHMLEDTLGWIVVLIGAIVMNFTDFAILDSLMSMGIAIYIFISAVRRSHEVIGILLNNTPKNISISQLSHDLPKEVAGVQNVHHMHIWSSDGITNYATLHATIAEKSDAHEVKHEIKKYLKHHGIAHATVEIETIDE